MVVEEREVEAVADGDEDMVEVGNGEEVVEEEQRGKEVAVGNGDEKMGAMEGQCGKEGADDAVGLGTEKGEDVDRTVVGKRGRSQQRQPFWVYVVAKVK